jgi:sugar phosphate isomerase/epimerase
MRPPQPIDSKASRRQFLKRVSIAPAMAATGLAAPSGEKYRLGVMAGMYASLPLDQAASRIRNAGYRYVSLARKHGDDLVFAPEMSKADRQSMLRRIRGLGLQPFLSLGGFAGDPSSEAGLQRYMAQLDLCADFEIANMVGAGPWYYTKFPNLPKRERDWQEEVTLFYIGLEKAIRHAESVKVVINLKPHTGITARARDCLQVVKRLESPFLQISWDAGNVSYYEGIYPDPDLPDLAPYVKSVCLKDHLGPRGENNFPAPGQGQVDHELMFRTLFSAGFDGPLSIERVDGRDGKKTAPEMVDERLKAANEYLVPLLNRITSNARQ